MSTNNGKTKRDSGLRPGLWILPLMGLVLMAGIGHAQTTEGSNVGLDLSKAVLVTPADLSPQEKNAIRMLVEEVEKRTLVRWNEVHQWPTDATAVVAVGPASAVKAFAGPHTAAVGPDSAPKGAEGYRLKSIGSGTPPVVLVVGNDARGVLFGAGRLLRELHMAKGSVRLADGLNIAAAPQAALRGHQLGYRPKTNSYDAWTAEIWDQYIRELAIFGNNAIELIPPRSDDAADSPHFPEPQIDMMAKMSKIADDYGLDVWIWYPAMDRDYSDPATLEFALKEWGDVYARLPRIDVVFVPGGDPGHTQPKYLMALLEKQTEVLHRTHPKAQMWMSPQSFNQEWTDEFLGIMKTQPAWLSGLVFAPQNRQTLEDLRKSVPAQYPIRHYPDITHTVKCQFPVPDWDFAYMVTESREPINPRPTDYTNIYRLFYKDTAHGFLTYSEGCNDDVNKIVWSCLGWDADAPVIDGLRQYARFFIGDQYTDEFAQGLMNLERNWRGPLLTNKGVFSTLAQFQAMERAASPQTLLNWRFQQALYRAYYDAYDARRLAYETGLQDQALDSLRQAGRKGSLAAMQEAESILNRAVLEPVAQDLRTRVSELAEALYQSIRVQLSVKRYKAITVDRGANFDLIDTPFNDRVWLQARFAEIRALPAEPQRTQALDEIVNWTNPGPGGFYDDLGSPGRQPHLVRFPGKPGTGYAGGLTDMIQGSTNPDPEYRTASYMSFQYMPSGRISWWTHAESRYDAPLQMHYDDLDPNADYKLRVIYGGDGAQVMMRCVANDNIEIHPFMKKEPPKPFEFDIPRAATAGGKLTLNWYGEPGRGGNGRGCNVAEVWLIRKTPQ